ncbi:MAG TPA: cytochrome c [Puia sp.]|nr:cytochrome c [Puia sp.]
MRAFALVLLVLLAGFFSCNSPQSGNGPTGGEQLPTTTFTIDPTKDTVLKTPGGALLKIAAGTFDPGEAKTVNLEVKEAATPAEMRKGSLSVNTGDTTLTSSGVIFVQLANGQNVSILKSFEVLVPARTLQQNMKLYKGRLDENGIVNWGVPEPLKGTPVSASDGKALYITNCASCHHLKGNATAPSLAFLSSRRDQRWLFAYTRSNAKLLWRGDPYTCFLFNRYKASPMPVFADLSDADLTAIYQYVTSASTAMGIDSNAVVDLKPGFDSCATNDARCSGVIEKAAKMPAVDTTQAIAAAAAVPENAYYTFSIDKHGWYNVAASGEDKATVDSTAVGTGEMLEPLQSCPCWCSEDAYRKADHIARAKPAK